MGYLKERHEMEQGRLEQSKSNHPVAGAAAATETGDEEKAAAVRKARVGGAAGLQVVEKRWKGEA